MKRVINLILFVMFFAGITATAQESSKIKVFNESISAEKSKDYDKAISVLQKYYEKSPNDYMYQLRLGWLYYLKGENDKSAEHYKQAIRLSNKSIEALLGITYPYSKMNLTYKLKDVYLEILKKEPGNYTANLNLGLIYFNEADYLNAMVFLEKVVENFPSDYSANLYLGWANYYEGGNKKARSYFERVLMISPNDPSALIGYKETK